MTRIPLVVFVATLGACIGVHVRTPGDPLPGATGTPYPTRGAPTGVVNRAGTYSMHVERFCRVSMPAGWIAVDYVADSGCAATNRNIDAHPVAIAVQYDKLPSGAELDVCDRERIPSTWYEIAWVDSEGRCPVDGTDNDPNRRTVRRIRKH